MLLSILYDSSSSSLNSASFSANSISTLLFYADALAFSKPRNVSVLKNTKRLNNSSTSSRALA